MDAIVDRRRLISIHELTDRRWPWDEFLKANIVFPHYTPKKIAVVDIGSNSIRLTIFQLGPAGITEIFDQKESCAIGRGMVDGNVTLDARGRKRALETLRDFKTAIRSHRTHIAYAIGTKAVRETSDTEFYRDACEALGCKPIVATAEQESILTALGLLYGIPYAHGLCFGIGGKSGHTARIDHGQIVASSLDELPEGILSLSEEVGDPLKIPGYLRRYHEFFNTHQNRGGVFFAGGGAWRDVGRELFQRVYHTVVAKNLNHGHPFDFNNPKVQDALNEMIIPRRRAHAQLDQIIKAARALMSANDFKEWRNDREEREELRPYAAALLKYAVQRTGSRQLVFFKHGIRQGALAEAGLLHVGLY